MTSGQVPAALPACPGLVSQSPVIMIAGRQGAAHGISYTSFVVRKTTQTTACCTVNRLCSLFVELYRPTYFDTRPPLLGLVKLACSGIAVCACIKQESCAIAKMTARCALYIANGRGTARDVSKCACSG